MGRCELTTIRNGLDSVSSGKHGGDFLDKLSNVGTYFIVAKAPNDFQVLKM
jgi:hypothetical protein